MKKLFSCFLFALVIACGSGTKTQFELKDNAQIGISFENNLSYSDDFNVYKYRNYYNGGGVALATSTTTVGSMYILPPTKAKTNSISTKAILALKT